MNNEVDLKDKKFEIFITDDEIASIVTDVSNKINNSCIKAPIFIAILNGSFVFAADIIRKINIPNSKTEYVSKASTKTQIV